MNSSTPSLGQYYLLEKLAQGGMAEIYKGLAYDMHGIQRTVVIKKILPHAAANPEFIDMLVSEAKIAVMLSHGNIAQIYDLGKAGEDYFIVMEYVEGRTVSQIQRESLSQGRYMPVPIACHIAAESAAGLGYMHQRCDERGDPLHIVHRDVSPQNVMVNASGTVKIIDFGIAKARTKLETTEIGILKGKFAYMSPEHARGEVIDHRSDVFSLGVMLHELLTGRRLFKAKDHKDTLKNVRRAEVPRPSSLREGIPESLDMVVLRALARDVEQRYQTADALRSDILRVLHYEFPDFRVAHVAEYVADLFAHPEDDVTEEQDAKTPFLIIDHTQSAIGSKQIDEGTVVHAGETAGDFLLPFLSRDAEETPAAAAAESSDADEPSITMQRSDWLVWCTHAWQRIRSWLQRPVAWPLVAVCGVVAVAVMLMLTWPQLRTWWQESPVPEQVERPRTVPEAVLGTLEIRTTPPGAEVYLDDRAMGCKTPCELDQLQVGTDHVLGLHLENYQYVSRPVTIAEGASTTIELALPLDYATLFVGSTPAGARVYLDGQYVGETPLERADMVPGRAVSMRIESPGHETIEQAVPMRPGRAEQVHVTLPRAKKR